jgi:ATP-dependent RNA helicase DeaD
LHSVGAEKQSVPTPFDYPHLVPPADTSVRFDSLGLSEDIVSAVTALGYEEPTPIQREAIPVLLAGRDLIGQAGTGTGKTAAFALPLLHRLAAAGAAKSPGPRGLILVPTRELAMQVAEAVHKYAKRTTMRVVPVYGGAPMDQQIRALRRGADVVVATPGRALDLMRRQTLTLDAVEVLVLDEADEMLDMGFAEDLETILTATPDTRQTALFAATMAPRIAAIAERHLTKPARVMIKAEKRAAGKMPRVRQTAFITTRPQKAHALGRILEFEDPASAIVFCRTRLEVDELTETLKSHGYVAQALHGGMEQRQRDRVMQQFRQEQVDVLVATDVAARGLDIEHVSHVINYDIPTSPEVYVHRIGRTGRIGREGVAITLVDPREQRLLRQIEALTRQPIEIAPLPTEAALQAKRLNSLRAALETRIGAGGLEAQRAFIAGIAHDLDVMDVAAAAIALLQGVDESPAAAAPTHEPLPEMVDGPMTPLFVSAGRSSGLRPGDFVGAITGEAHLTSKQLGKITIGPHHSLVDVPEPLVDRVIRALQRTTLRGQRVEVRRHRPERRSAAEHDRPRRP